MKSVIKRFLILLMLTNSLCQAEVVLRFQSEIDDKATRLGDILVIENDKQDWSSLPLDSHPPPGSTLSKDTLLDWIMLHTGHINATWQGKTQTQVKQSRQSSGTQLMEKAKLALMEQLRTHYLRVEVTPLSRLNDSAYALTDYKTDVKLTVPTSKRVCVWLTRNNSSRIAVWFNIKAYAKVMVANREVRYNTPLQNDAFALKERNIAGLNSSPVHKIPQSSWLKSSIEPSTILLESHIKKAPLVVQGQHINIAVHNHSITVVMDAIALADGYLGETITVKNPINQKTFVARISGFQQAEITS